MSDTWIIIIKLSTLQPKEYTAAALKLRKNVS